MERVSSNTIAGALDERSSGNLLLRRWFLVSLLLGTWVPIVFFTLIAPSAGPSGGLANLKAVFLFLGTAHVPATLFFYADKDFSSIRKSHRVRYILVPITLILVTGAVFAFASFTIQALALLIY